LIQAGKVRRSALPTRRACPAFPNIPTDRRHRAGLDAAAWQMLSALRRPAADRRQAVCGVKSICHLDINTQICQRRHAAMENPSVEVLQAFVKSEIVRWARSCNSWPRWHAVADGVPICRGGDHVHITGPKY